MRAKCERGCNQDIKGKGIQSIQISIQLIFSLGKLLLYGKGLEYEWKDISSCREKSWKGI